MKTELLAYLCIISVLISACATNNTKKESKENSPKDSVQESSVSVSSESENVASISNIDNSEHTTYHKQIYDGQYITITLESIYHDHINFSVESKLKNNKIKVSLDSVALDGLVPPESYSDTSFPEIGPGETVSADINADINYTEHKYLSTTFVVFNDEGAGIESNCVVNFNIGSNKNIEYKEPEETLIYDSAPLSIFYVGAEDTGIRLRTKNKLETALSVAYDTPFQINGKDIGEYSSVRTIPPCSTMDYYIYVKEFDPDYTPSSVKSFSCTGNYYSDSNRDEFSITSETEVSPYYELTKNGSDTSNNDHNTEHSLTEQEAPSSNITSTYDNTKESEDDTDADNDPIPKEEDLSTISITERSFREACSLTVSDCIKKRNKYGNGYDYYYKGLPLLSEDVSWIEDPLNKDGTINQGAIYRKLAKVMQGIKIGLADYTDFSTYVIGFVPKTKDEFLDYTEDLYSFIVMENEFESIMKKFETLKTVNGKYNYAYFESGKFDPSSSSFEFEISNVTECAEELKIKEEMLGYILAFLEEYGPDTEFSGNSFTFSYRQ